MAYPLFSFLRSFFHRISWMNRRRSCLSDYSRIFADIWPLANGWRPKCSLIVFVTQISQMTQIFLIDYLSPTDFTDLHRFFSLIIFLMELYGFSLIFFFFLSFLLFFCHFFFFRRFQTCRSGIDFADFSHRLFFSKFYEKFV